MSPLFTPFTIKHLTLPNRIVMAPMTRSQSPGGVPGPEVAAYYARRAAHGVGLIVTEGTYIDHPTAGNNPSVPRFYGEDALAGWAAVLAAVRAAGGHIVPQLWHIGMANDAYPETLSTREIAAIVDAYARAAADAHRLGFDGIELHGAHGYLIDQFLWETTNRRTDEYGGSLIARTRFAAEVVRACRQAVGADFPIILRYSQWKLRDYTAKLASTPAALGEMLAPLVDAGVDVFHCSTRRFWEPEFEGSPLNLAGWTKTLTGVPTITVGSVGLDEEFMAGIREGKAASNAGIERVLAMLSAGEVDLVAVGRALLVDPAWAEKIARGRTAELVPFTREALKTLS